MYTKLNYKHQNYMVSIYILIKFYGWTILLAFPFDIIVGCCLAILFITLSIMTTVTIYSVKLT